MVHFNQKVFASRRYAACTHSAICHHAMACAPHERISGKIPLALVESAKIDGAGEWRIFYQIVLPLSKPGLATVGLFTAFAFWNDRLFAMLFIDNQKLVPLQYMLYRILNNIQYLSTSLQTANIKVKMTDLPNESARMAIAILAAGPILFVFPFFQKYFIRGLTVGAIKG